ncbi:MAG TPA: hypothetical protein DGH68_10940 [Bacteroidetes bacterium]|nr:hypothetical protein [Bacteroidota bacterium]
MLLTHDSPTFHRESSEIFFAYVFPFHDQRSHDGSHLSSVRNAYSRLADSIDFGKEIERAWLFR